MRDNDYPTEVSDPESSGLPDTADDDSNAYDSVESSRWADGADPAALAGVGPGGSNRFGDTAEEAREGESLDNRLRQEEPDFGAADPIPQRRDPYDETVDSSEQRDFDADVWGASPTSDPKSQVSLYDDGQLAYDAGAAGGGASAEELAIHETNAPDYE